MVLLLGCFSRCLCVYVVAWLGFGGCLRWATVYFGDLDFCVFGFRMGHSVWVGFVGGFALDYLSGFMGGEVCIDLF